MSTTTSITKKSITSPDEVRQFPHGRLELLQVGDVNFGRMTVEPGWSWSGSVKPLAQTDSCEFPHKAFVLSGTLHVKMDDGTELDLVAGDVAVIAPGHDAWVVGDEACVLVDFADDDVDYATPAQS